MVLLRFPGHLRRPTRRSGALAVLALGTLALGGSGVAVAADPPATTTTTGPPTTAAAAQPPSSVPAAPLAPPPAPGPPPPMNVSVVGEAPNGNGVFRFPQAIGVDPVGGGVFVGDEYSGMIQAFDANGTFRFAFGLRAEDAQPGRLGVVGGVAVDRSGHVFVLDSENDRVQIYSATNGAYLGTFGNSSILKVRSTGHRPDAGIVAGGIAVSQRDPTKAITVYIADSGHNRIVRYAVSPTSLRPYGPVRFTNDRLVRLRRPQGVAVSPSGNKVYVPDNQNHRVVVLHPTTMRKLGEVGSFGGGQGQFRAPYDVAIDAHSPSQMYVADNLNGRVNVYGARRLEYLGTYGGNGHDLGKFSFVRAVASNVADPTGGVFVADTANNRIQRLSARGKLLAAWGTAGRGPGYVTRPRGVTFTPSGGIAIADTFDNRVEFFDAGGTYSGQFGRISTTHGFATGGHGSGQMLLPAALAYDGAGNLWVADTYNSRIIQFDPAGHALRTTRKRSFSRARGMASAPDGSVYVANTGQSKIQKVTPDGVIITVRSGIHRPVAVTVGASGVAYAATAKTIVDLATGARVPPPPDEKSWDRPQGLALAPDGTLYVSEARPKTVNGARVVRGTPNALGGRTWDTLATEGGGANQVIDPANLAVNPSGETLLVADAGNNRILRFDVPGSVPPPTNVLGVSLAGDQTRGAVTSEPPGIDCGTDCGQHYGIFRRVTLTARPVDGSEFVGWSGACAPAGTTRTCTLSMAATQSVGATFQAIPPRPVRMAAVGLSPTRWYLARKKSKKHAARETTQARLTVRLTQPAHVNVQVLQERVGKRIGKRRARCVAVRHPQRLAQRERCARFAPLPVKRKLRLLKGRTVATIDARFGARTLRPGLYRLRLTAVDEQGNTATRTTRMFRVVR